MWRAVPLCLMTLPVYTLGVLPSSLGRLGPGEPQCGAAPLSLGLEEAWSPWRVPGALCRRPGGHGCVRHTRGPANCCLLKPPSSGEVCRAAEAQTGFTQFPGIAENRPGLHAAGTFSVGIKNTITFTAAEPLKPPSLLSPEAAVPLHVGALSVFSSICQAVSNTHACVQRCPPRTGLKRDPQIFSGRRGTASHFLQVALPWRPAPAVPPM